MSRAGRQELLQRLEYSVQNSIAVVVASVLEDKLPSYSLAGDNMDEASGGRHSPESSAVLHYLCHCLFLT